MIRFTTSLMARCNSKDRPKLPTEKERPQAPAFQEHSFEHSFKSVPNEWE